MGPLLSCLTRALVNDLGRQLLPRRHSTALPPTSHKFGRLKSEVSRHTNRIIFQRSCAAFRSLISQKSPDQRYDKSCTSLPLRPNNRSTLDSCGKPFGQLGRRPTTPVSVLKCLMAVSGQTCFRASGQSPFVDPLNGPPRPPLSRCGRA